MDADKKAIVVVRPGAEQALKELTESIIGAAYRVANTLGCGFFEKVYENALAHELTKQGLLIEQQKAVDVWYDGVVVGFYITDVVVNDAVIVELKCAKCLDEMHLAQCLNYLKATNMKLALLMNFGPPKIEIRRVVNNL